MAIELAREWHEEYDELKARTLREATRLNEESLAAGGFGLFVHYSEEWVVGDLRIRLKLTRRITRTQPQYKYWQGQWFCNDRGVGYNNLRGQLRRLHQDTK